MFWKESDQGRRSKHIPENKESDKLKGPKTIPENKGM
jgi:hypothetical protein